MEGPLECSRINAVSMRIAIIVYVYPYFSPLVKCVSGVVFPIITVHIFIRSTHLDHTRVAGWVL